MGLALFLAWLKTVSYLGRDGPSPAPIPLRKTEAEREALRGRRALLGQDLRGQLRLRRRHGNPLEFQFGTNWARFSNYAGGAGSHTLKAALIWWPIGMALAAVCFASAYRMFFRSAAKPRAGHRLETA